MRFKKTQLRLEKELDKYIDIIEDLIMDRLEEYEPKDITEQIIIFLKKNTVFFIYLLPY